MGDLFLKWAAIILTALPYATAAYFAGLTMGQRWERRRWEAKKGKGEDNV